MEPKRVSPIDLSSQGSEHRRSQEFGLRAAQKRSVLSHGYWIGLYVSADIIFVTVQPEI